VVFQGDPLQKILYEFHVIRMRKHYPRDIDLDDIKMNLTLWPLGILLWYVLLGYASSINRWHMWLVIGLEDLTWKQQGRICEVQNLNAFRRHDVQYKFHKDWFSVLKVVEVTQKWHKGPKHVAITSEKENR
jgi:hypothetical protein